MSIHTPPAALSLQPDPAPTHRRTESLATLRRPASASLRDPVLHPDLPNHPSSHQRATPPPGPRRRSSAATPTADGALALFTDGAANINRWSQSTTSSYSSPPRDRDRDPHHHHHHHHQQYHQQYHHHHEPGHPQQPAVLRRLSFASSAPLAGLALHGAAPRPESPSRRNDLSSPSPTSSPRRATPRSPAHGAPPTAAAPQLPSLPPFLLPDTLHHPNTPPTASTNDTPSTAGLFTPSIFGAGQTRDYFNSKPLAPPSGSKAERVLGKPLLGSPAIIGVHDADPRHDTAFGTARPSTARRPSIPAFRETAQQQAQIAGHRQTASRDLLRDTSRDHNRSESHTSARLEDNYQGTPPRSREKREKDKKTMLSRALQKANTAVLLDNAQNFEGAMEAYEDACKLLQQVMIRSSQEEDRRKLDAIRVTYTNRIEELGRLDSGYSNGAGKSLPARPMSGESLDEHRSMLLMDDDDPSAVQTASSARIVNDRSVDHSPFRADPEPPPPVQPLPLRRAEAGPRESVISTAIRDVERGMHNSQFHLQAPPGKSSAQPTQSLRTPGVEPAIDRTYMPPPLSPGRPKSPLFTANRMSELSEQNVMLQPQQTTHPKHQRSHSNESTSWLDTIDESGGSSCSSSVHSLSLGAVRRKHIRSTSGATEAEFDAALDAAVEAAYDEGYEPYDDEESGDRMATRLRNVELAKERVREVEREDAIAAATYRYKETRLRNQALPHVRESAELGFNEEAEEEERLLDEMTEYMLDGFDFDLQTKSSLPRQSDSSGFSGSTYNSSVSSHRTTGGTSLSTVAEVLQQPKGPKAAPVHSPPTMPAPLGALPPVPESQKSQTSDAAEVTPRPTTATKDATSVRSRRLSGQNAKDLKIETSLPPVLPGPHTEKPPIPAKDSSLTIAAQPKSAAAAALGGNNTAPTLDPALKVPALPHVSHSAGGGLTAPSPQPLLHSPAETIATSSPGTPAALNHAVSNETGLVPGSPRNAKNSVMGIRKNKSSLSLKQRTLSMSSPDGSEGSMGTPLTQTFSITVRKQSNAADLAMPTPSVPTFNMDGLTSGGMHLFESDIHSAFAPGSPSPAVANAPIPLEPCPDSYLLRPFWLMRCFYQTIAHTRGGYLSTKLFIPRDVWRVKGVKLKNIEDKIANCDLLTAAMQKLASVDTLDADAMLEEMQAFEVVLDQVQAVLAKKLGNEVGVHSVSTLFKDATTVGEGTAMESISRIGTLDHPPKSAVMQSSKSYLSSWRKLRSKNSGVNLASMASTSAKSEVPKDSLIMSTLPMTNLHTIRFAKRDISSVVFEGPNSGYMSSLARLFDAAQILDQIARQVEDPGLKHSSPTHVGLELSARHAAEFFGFYICRFVLTDVTMLLDKFIKRGSEWVLV
ncbi:hypothetical protein ACEQ8H_001137 [Pleosporales sp. CAS-2024a]